MVGRLANEIIQTGVASKPKEQSVAALQIYRLRVRERWRDRVQLVPYLTARAGAR